MNTSSLGEQQISPIVEHLVSPDIKSPQGQSQLFAKAVAANKIKGVLDTALKIASEKLGGTFSSRVKDFDTTQKKITQKRLEGRDYGLEHINDIIGGRITINKPSDFAKAKAEIGAMEKAGLFKINKQETVKTGSYEAFHNDVTFPDGTKGELQIHLPQSEAESIANHDLRSQFGEKPISPTVKKLRDTQAAVVAKLPNDKARAVSDAIQNLRKQSPSGMLNPVITAQVLQQVKAR